ncbi:MAG: response regulator, partial [Clostridia bacterium]|nr:response regulator [Clostridia bacterium]
MIGMLLVEDESFERMSLATCVDWSLIGVHIIAEAANGSQGLSKALELRPDIVLTDVKMPVMDGIEMSRRLRNALPDTKILFLSSYDDFEYAKQAIGLNISAYLMKPVNETELLRTVKKAADELEEERLEKMLLSKERDHLSRSGQLARQALLNRFLGGVRLTDTDLRSLGLEWFLDPGQTFLIILCTYEPGAVNPIDVKLEALLKAVSKACSHTAYTSMSEGQTVLLCGIGREDAQKAAQRVGVTLRAFFESESVDVRVTMKSGDNADQLYTDLLAKAVRMPHTAEGKAHNKDRIVSEMKEIIKRDYAQPLTLESVARLMHFTPNYLGTIFRNLAGISVSHYLLETRLACAKEMMEA